MIFTETSLKGAFVVELEKHADSRGFFARSFCCREFESRGLVPVAAQCNVSFNRAKGTLRGMHYQAPPHDEARLVRCTRGAIYDVIVDWRRESPTFCQWVAVDLTATNHRMLYVPKGFAHGFQTLKDDSEVFYQMSDYYEPDASRGVRWDDPALGIEWPPSESRIISERDLSLPLLSSRLGAS